MKNKSTVVIAFIILTLCMILYFFPSIKMMSSENRTLATFDMVAHPLENSEVYRKRPIDRFEVALSDQFPFRDYVVKKYQRLFNVTENYTYGVAKLFLPLPVAPVMKTFR